MDDDSLLLIQKCKAKNMKLVGIVNHCREHVSTDNGCYDGALTQTKDATVRNDVNIPVSTE